MKNLLCMHSIYVKFYLLTQIGIHTKKLYVRIVWDEMTD